MGGGIHPKRREIPIELETVVWRVESKEEAPDEDCC